MKLHNIQGTLQTLICLFFLQGCTAVCHISGITKPSDPYAAEIVSRIHEHLRYPKDACQKQEEGTSLIVFDHLHDGRITNVRILESSGSASLDREALRVLEIIARRGETVPRKDDVPATQPIARYSLPIVFRLQ